MTKTKLQQKRFLRDSMLNTIRSNTLKIILTGSWLILPQKRQLMYQKCCKDVINTIYDLNKIFPGWAAKSGGGGGGEVLICILPLKGPLINVIWKQHWKCCYYANHAVLWLLPNYGCTSCLSYHFQRCLWTIVLMIKTYLNVSLYENKQYFLLSTPSYAGCFMLY